MIRPRVVLQLAALVLCVAGCSADPPQPPPASPAPPGIPAPAVTAVLTQKDDPARSGWNAHETVLTQVEVNAGRFGRRTSYPVDGAVYAQPLFMPGLLTGNGVHNTAFVATEHDSVYAFDADVTGKAAAPLWQRSLLPSGAKPVSSADDLGKLLNGHDLIIDLRTRGRITVRPALPEAGAQTASNTQS